MTNSTSSDSFFPHDIELSPNDQLIISIFLLVVGVILCFFGKKIFKIFLFVIGFAALSAATYYVLLVIDHKHQSLDLSKAETIAIPLAAGLVGGIVVLAVVQIGFFLAGASVGAVISFLLFAVVGNNFGDHAFVIRLVILGVFAVVCGGVVVWQEKKLIIVISAIGGSYAIFAGVDHWVKSGYVDAVHGIFEDDILPDYNTSLSIMLAGTVATAFFGILVQFIMDRRRKKRGGWESDPLLGSVN